MVVSLPGERVAPFPKAAVGASGGVKVFQRRDVGEAHSNQIRNLSGAGLRDVAERVAADVAVVGGVGQRADADAVEDDPDDAFEWWHWLLR